MEVNDRLIKCSNNQLGGSNEIPFMRFDCGVMPTVHEALSFKVIVL